MLNLNDGEILAPNAGAMVESLRAFGYNLETAIADLIDNSITAKAKKIDLFSDWDGATSSLLLLDNGQGMSQTKLREALRPGSRNPLEDRHLSDLGRFGLGLKTASFSQCRQLTVASKEKNASEIYAYCWDLDLINQTNKWLLLPVKVDDIPGIHRLREQESGTLVVWQKLDHLVGSSANDDEVALEHFRHKITGVKEHIEMVFHRFMTGAGKIEFFVNGFPLRPWDPFLLNETATQALGNERYGVNNKFFEVSSYVLPHHSKISADVHKRAEGTQGWNAHQGFYIYRNKRLLVAGDWFGFYRKEEHYKLARIQIDLPNSMDHEWNIDVKKSHARPPAVVRKQLKAIADKTRKRASEVYRHRGKQIGRKTNQTSVHAWQQKSKHGKTFYKINREHPLVSNLLKRLKGDDKKSVAALLTFLEETIPVSSIFIQSTESPDTHTEPFEMIPNAEIEQLISIYYQSLRNSELNHVQAIGNLRTNKAFETFENVINKIAGIDQV